MKKLILILFVALSFNIEAQYITNYAKNVKQTEIDGIYYYLPRNVIKLDFTVEEKQDIKGKFVNYTKELLNTDNYKDCVLKAVNLGGDTDTIAAIAGGLAGLMYGYESIPQEWLDTLLKREEIEELCERAERTWRSI